MTVTSSNRFGITRWDAGGDPFTRDQMDMSHRLIDEKAAGFIQGDGPPSESLSPAAYEGFFYYSSTNSSDGSLFYSNGSGWKAISEPASIVEEVGATEIVGTSLQYARADHVHVLADDVVTADKIDVLDYLEVSGNLTVDTNTLFVDAVNNEVGIGTTTPSVKLDVVGVIKGADGVVTLTSSGAPSATIADGALAVDTTNDTFYIRSRGSWVPVGGGGLSGVPTGTVQYFAGSVAPSGWLLCDGAAVSRTTYAALFSLIGETFGAGDGSTTFNLPDATGRSFAHPDPTAAPSALGVAGGYADAATINHTHVTDINHDHAAFSVSGGSHSHTSVSLDVSGTAETVSGSDFLYSGVLSSSTNLINGGTSYTYPSAFNDIANHTHDVSGTATGTVGSTSSSHSHSIDVPALGTTNKTSDNPSTAVSATNRNWHPFLALNAIIKT